MEERHLKRVLELMGKTDISEEMAITKREAFLGLALDFIFETASSTKDYNEIMTTIGIAIGGIRFELASSLAAMQINEHRLEWLEEFKVELQGALDEIHEGREKAKKEKQEKKEKK